VPSRARRGLEVRSRGKVWGVKTLHFCRCKWADFGDTSEDAARDRKNRRVLALQLSDVLIVKFETIRLAVLGGQSLRWGRIFLLETLFAAHGNSADLKAPSPQAHATCGTFRIEQEAFRNASVQPPPPRSRLPGCPLDPQEPGLVDRPSTRERSCDALGRGKTSSGASGLVRNCAEILLSRHSACSPGRET
jgi:hypothetical protein